MDLPCQKIVWDVIPAIRAALAEELVGMGVSSLQASKLLGIAPSAVSQYLSKKRGYRIEFESEVREELKLLAEDLKDGRVKDLTSRMCAICKIIRTDDGCGE